MHLLDVFAAFEARVDALDLPNLGDLGWQRLPVISTLTADSFWLPQGHTWDSLATLRSQVCA